MAGTIFQRAGKRGPNIVPALISLPSPLPSPARRGATSNWRWPWRAIPVHRKTGRPLPGQHTKRGQHTGLSSGSSLAHLTHFPGLSLPAINGIGFNPPPPPPSLRFHTDCVRALSCSPRSSAVSPPPPLSLETRTLTPVTHFQRHFEYRQFSVQPVLKHLTKWY